MKGAVIKNILLTGPPRCGKSTVIERLVRQIKRPVRGFFTREIREEGKRVGFAIISLDGQEGVPAHEDSPSSARVGKYGVNLDQLEKIAVPSIIPTNPEHIVIVDEIGKMECLSPLFRETLLETLDSPNPVIGSITLKGTPFIAQVKERKDIILVTVLEKNRDSIPACLLEKI
jgi:nucleoside-triphosphatase